MRMSDCECVTIVRWRATMAEPLVACSNVDYETSVDPVTADEMERMRLEARGLARLLGASVATLEASFDSCRWIASDP